MPPSSTCGATITGMNCTTWNSVVAKALANSPSIVPSSPLTAATSTSIPSEPSISRPHTHTAHATAPGRRPAGERPEGGRVAADEVALAERQREQPLEGAAAAFAQGRDARHEEHDDEREHAEHRGPHLGEHGGVVEDPGDEADEQRRHDEQQPDRARVVPDLGEHASGGGERQPGCHAAPSLPDAACRPWVPDRKSVV